MADFDADTRGLRGEPHQLCSAGHGRFVAAAKAGRVWDRDAKVRARV